MNPRKVLVIGLDGATWDVILKYVEAGHLPAFDRLLRGGTWGSLRSTIPASTPSGWMSMVTGVNPGKHNIYGFFSFDNPKRVAVTNHKTLKARAIWDYLGAGGLNVGMVNIPLTYPPVPVNGFMVSGMGTPGEKSTFAYPTALGAELIAKGYIVEAEGDAGLHLIGVSEEEYAQKVWQGLGKRAEASLDLMREHDWDFLMVVFTETDRMQHFYWENIGRTQGDTILETYRRIDGIIAEMLNHVDKTTTVFLTSDHGFCSVKERLYINTFLMRLGLLRNKRSLLVELLRKLGFTRQRLSPLMQRLARKINIDGLLKAIPRRLIEMVPSETFDLRQIDLTRTKVYYPFSSDGLKVNLRKRDPKGIVQSGNEYDSLLTYVIDKLNELRHPETGEKVFSHVFRRDEIYHGPYVKNALDIVFELQDNWLLGNFSDQVISTHLAEDGYWSGKHAPSGIFLAWGPDIKQGTKIDGADVTDVTPTILHLMGLPVSENMDGRVLQDIFEQDSEPARRKVVYQCEGEEVKVKGRIRKLKGLGKI
ncbi:MAG: alkaline phosphatase family protein [Chloroflexi bacterium]|nr:alkaline phosphatase family protein [Chloroflexota bacterium]